VNKIKILMLGRDEKTSNILASQLRDVFLDQLDIQMGYLEGGLPATIDANLVLVTLQSYIRIVAPLVTRGTDIMVIRRTLSVDSWAKLQAIPVGTKAMLVNDTLEAAEDTIALIYELGAKHLLLTPVYPGLEHTPKLELAITPGEMEYIPNGVKEVLDIGPRVFDITTLMDITAKFNLMRKLGNTFLLTYMEQIIPHSVGLKGALGNVVTARRQLGTILDTVNEGVWAYDCQGKVIIFNRVMEQLTGKARWQVAGQFVAAIFTELNIPAEIITSDYFYDRVYSILGKKFLVSKLPLEEEDACFNNLLTFKETTQIEKLELKVRQDLKQNGLWAKYTFDCIVGVSTAIKECINYAQKMAQVNSAVLIQGESGVGKELFAQAIHNASNRKNGPFVAVNCAALPEALLESELYGYEEGAFTGARKGGKPGLFEQAHKGTIFLDEIGDIPLSLQSRLLRVLQEKEVMRIGGTGIIPVDVRIIAATNHSLQNLLEYSLFRADLYYRLNVLPLHVPPLRERLEDIPQLINFFQVKLEDRRRLSQEILNFLQQYSWPGNVRQLQNCIEYLVYISDQNFVISDLPKYLFEGPLISSSSPKKQWDLDYFILKQLEIASRTCSTLGRYQLFQLAKDAEIVLTESKVRTKLEHLKSHKLIKQISARQGNAITPEGLKILKQWKEEHQ